MTAAFPHSYKDRDGGDEYVVIERGMTLRDYFAAQAISAMIHLSQDVDGGWSVENVANGCYNLADAMLAARQKSTP